MAVAQRQAAVEFLLRSREPAIRFLTRRDVLGEDVTADTDEFHSGLLVRGLLRGQKRDGGFGGHPYQKWGGAHWRLVSLVELGVPADERLLAAAETVLDWLTSDGHRKRIQAIDGLTRRCGSQEGNALAVCCRLGMATDARVELLARSLAEWQWPDGGWNCDKKASGRRSSFNESLPPMWGLHEYWAATGETWARDSADLTAELFLEHDLLPHAGHRRADPSRMALGALPAVLAQTRSRRRCSSSPAPASSTTRAPRTDSTSSSAFSAMTAAGTKARPGGASRALRAATSRSSTGAGAGRAR